MTVIGRDGSAASNMLRARVFLPVPEAPQMPIGPLHFASTHACRNVAATVGSAVIHRPNRTGSLVLIGTSPSNRLSHAGRVDRLAEQVACAGSHHLHGHLNCWLGRHRHGGQSGNQDERLLQPGGAVHVGQSQIQHCGVYGAQLRGYPVPAGPQIPPEPPSRPPAGAPGAGSGRPGPHRQSKHIPWLGAPPYPLLLLQGIAGL